MTFSSCKYHYMKNYKQKCFFFYDSSFNSMTHQDDVLNSTYLQILNRVKKPRAYSNIFVITFSQIGY